MRRSLLSILLLLALTGCTAKISYNYAGWWANWLVGNYISLDRQQQRLFNRQFGELHRWHRRTQLPLYADFLDTLTADLGRENLDASHIRQRALEAQALLDSSREKVIPCLAELLNSLSGRQQEKLLATLREQFDEYRQDHIDIEPQKRVKQRARSMSRYARSWLGSLSKNQRQRIANWSQQIQPAAQMELASQKRWRQRFAEVMNSRGENPRAVANYLNDYLFQSNNHLPPGGRATIEHNWQLTGELAADLLNGLPDRQRHHLSNELEKLAEDFRELSSRE